MAEWRKVQTRFWDDPDTLDMTPEDRLFYIYLLTNPLTTSCGIYTLHPKQAVMHTGYNLETIQSLIKRFIQRGYIKYSQETREVMINDWFKYNSPKSPKLQSLIKKELKDVKNSEFYDEVRVKIGRQGSEEHDTVSEEHDTVSEKHDTVSEKTPLDVDVDVDVDVDEDIDEETDKDKDLMAFGSTEDPLEKKIQLILDHLNEARGLNSKHKFRSSKGSGLQARLKEGYTLEDCCLVIDHAVAKWAGDERMEQYIRPSTLFGAEKFQSYWIQANAWNEQGRPMFNNSAKRKLDLEAARRFADGES